MVMITVFGQPMLLKENPWARVGMSTKGWYLARPPDFVMDKSKMSAAQRAVQQAFAETARRSIAQFPADGSFSTLVNRVKWIGQQMRAGPGAYGGTYKIPQSATPQHPLYQAAPRAQRGAIGAT